MTHPITYDEAMDRELRVVQGEGWSIPVYVMYCVSGGERSMHIMPAVPLGYAQHGRLQGVLELAGAQPLTHGWLLPEGAGEDITMAVRGVTPEFHFVWGGERPSRPEAGEPPKPKSAKARPPLSASDEFIDHVASTCGIGRETLAIAWAAVTQCAHGWLVSGRSIDLGVFRIVAVPYRRNWKQLVLARYPGMAKLLLLTNPRRLIELVFSSASRIIRGSELTECRTRRGREVFGWNVEVLTSPIWDRMCEDAEVEASARLGPIGYLKRWANRVSAMEETIYALLREEVQEEGAPTCRVLWRRGDSGPRFRQASPTILRCPTIVECDDGGGGSIDDFIGIEDRAKYLEAAAARLLEVRPEEPAVDVRIPGGDVPDPSGDGGVLVLPSAGGKAAREGVLAGGGGHQEGMDPQ